jgi:hypothetical protein
LTSGIVVGCGGVVICFNFIQIKSGCESGDERWMKKVNNFGIVC